jgi:hypothetical protein
MQQDKLDSSQHHLAAYGDYDWQTHPTWSACQDSVDDIMHISMQDFVNAGLNVRNT